MPSKHASCSSSSAAWAGGTALEIRGDRDFGTVVLDRFCADRVIGIDKNVVAKARRRLAGRAGKPRCKSGAAKWEDHAPPSDATTIGGLLAEQLGRLPAVGDRVPLGRHVAEVISVQARTVERVGIEPHVADNTGPRSTPKSTPDDPER